MSIRLDDLCVNGYKIYQDDDGFCFGTDAVLLAWFAGEKKFATAADLCTGNGVIPVLLSTHKCCKEIRGYEIAETPYTLAKMTIEFNKLTDKISFYLRDITNTTPDETFPYGYFDLVTVNPPYMPQNSGLVSAGARAAARTELTCTLKDTVKAANVLLKNGGRFCMINKPERLADAMCEMREKKIEPKRLRFVCTRSQKKPELFLIEGIKQGRPGLVCEPTLDIYDKNGEYTEEINRIYGRI